MIILQADGVKNTVAWEHHLSVQLHCQNPEFATPSKENLITEHKKTTATMTNLPLSSVEVPLRDE
jgi:hypothetical protein